MAEKLHDNHGPRISGGLCRELQRRRHECFKYSLERRRFSGSHFRLGAIEQREPLLVQWHNPPTKDLLKKPLLGQEVIIDRAEIDAGAVGYRPDRNRLRAVLRE